MTPMSIVVVTLWILFAATLLRVLIPFRLARLLKADTTWAALSGACALSLGVDEIYVFLDQVLWSLNIVNLLKHTFLVLCAYFLARAVLSVADAFTPKLRRALNVALLFTALTQTAAFVAIGATPTATAFVETFGTRPPTLVYSLSHFLFFAVAEGLAVAIAVSVAFRRGVPKSQYAGLVALAVGGLAAVLNFGVTTARDVARFHDATDTAESLDSPYKALLVIIALGNCLGLGAPAVVGFARRIREQSDIRTLHSAASRYEGGSTITLSAADLPDDPLAPLREAVLAIRNVEASGVVLVLTGTERRALTRAEKRLEESSDTPCNPPSLRRTTYEGKPDGGA